MSRKNKFDVGSIHDTNLNGKVEVIEKVDSKHRRVRFLTTGYTTIASLSNISSGRIKDNLAPSVCGVGYLGYCEQFDNHPMRKRIYGKWANMINCSKRNGYEIKPEHLCFANFMEECLKDPYWEVERIRAIAESILTDGLQWDGVPKEVRESRPEWWADLRHMIDYLADPERI